MNKQTLQQKYLTLLNSTTINCGQGWLGIIDALCESIELHVQNSNVVFREDTNYNEMAESARKNNWILFQEYYLNWPTSEIDKKRQQILSEPLRIVTPPCPKVILKKIEVKSGVLDIEYQGGDNVVTGMIAVVKTISKFTCEKCGSPGILRGKGWVYTSCENHANQPNLKFYEETE
jgi:predicted RNA-binding Zn-ribbon protein involved in translation (DUF1610 family)